MTDLGGPVTVVVFRTASDVEATIVRGLLESSGIPTLVSSDAPQAILPLAVAGIGEVRIAVPESEADEARQVIASFRSAPMGADPADWADDLVELEQRLGHAFADRGLLERALTHRSRVHEGPAGTVEDNEALEFLGDAVLGLVVAELLHERFPEFDEGRKSKIKASLVSAPSLARAAERLGLGECLRLGRGEDKTGGRQKPAVLADAYEAVIAAVHLDGGIDASRALIRRDIESSLARWRQPGLLTAATGDFKSALQERLQSRGAAPPAYRLVASHGPDHRKQFVVEVSSGDRLLGSAEGGSKKEAEQRAAEIALSVLEESPGPSGRGEG
jgi:ribonuclease-3